MKTLTLALAAAAIGMAGFAYAGSTKAPTMMSDTQMDHVVAGFKIRPTNNFNFGALELPVNSNAVSSAPNKVVVNMTADSQGTVCVAIGSTTTPC